MTVTDVYKSLLKFELPEPKNTEEPAKAPDTEPTTAFYVSTTLEIRQFEDADDLGRDLLLNDVAFRKLDPTYFAWLRYKLNRANSAFQNGRMTEDQFYGILTPYMAVKAEALAWHGEDALDQAWRDLLPKIDLYRPPSRKLFEEAGAVERYRKPLNNVGGKTGKPMSDHAWPTEPNAETAFLQPVSAEALEKVAEIEKQADSLGWRREWLYQNRGRFAFPYGPDYGLVCFLDRDGTVIGRVARDEIELHLNRASGTRPFRFRRPR